MTGPGGSGDPSELVSAYLDGCATRDEAAWVEAHAADDEVAAAMSETRALKSLLGGLALPAPSERTWHRLVDGVAAEAAKDTRRAGAARALGAAAVVLLLCGVGLALVLVARPRDVPATSAVEAAISRPNFGSAAPSSAPARLGGGAGVAMPVVLGPLIDLSQRPAPSTSTTSTRPRSLAQVPRGTGQH